MLFDRLAIGKRRFSAAILAFGHQLKPSFAIFPHAAERISRLVVQRQQPFIVDSGARNHRRVLVLMNGSTSYARLYAEPMWFTVGTTSGVKTTVRSRSSMKRRYC